ncbi:Rv3235 family protein [Isoptericola sp. AK164]|uniref:Rv3235 family protein n=1 Tax=Isoptericola sp. AK164 TaxID=3024246 RepID=UPI002418A800|nr:Rv3235 family protein [Isoptericola sp. AK164]
MTVTPTAPPRQDPPQGPRPRRLRVSAPPGGRPPARPPQAPTHRPPSRRVRVGADSAPPAPVPGRPLAPTEQPAAPHPADPTALCCSVVRAAVEVLRGERPVAQVARWVTPQVYDQLTQRARLLRSRPAAAATTRPVAVRRVRMVRLGAATAEATVVLEDRGRVRAAAARLEVHRGTWRVAVLELG